MRATLAISVVFALTAAIAPAARAQDATRTPTMPIVAEDDAESNDWLLRRKHTLAEFETGMLALPTAPIAPGQRGGNLPIGTIGHGDATLLVGAHILYRGGRDWALGAGTSFAPLPTSDDTYGGASGLSRTHARSYLTLGGEARYIPVHVGLFEAWGGLTAGVLVISDRFTTNSGDAVPQILGTKTVTARTEGLSVGLQIGGDYLFAERVFVGLAGRLNHWVLPATPTCTPIGDCATLTGPVTELELGIRLGYRIPL